MSDDELYAKYCIDQGLEPLVLSEELSLGPWLA